MTLEILWILGMSFGGVLVSEGGVEVEVDIVGWILRSCGCCIG